MSCFAAFLLLSAPILRPPAECFPQTEIPAPDTSAESLYAAGQQALAECRREEGRAWLERAIRADPNFAPAYIQLGYLDLWEQRNDAALRHFQTALYLCPCDSQVAPGLEELLNAWADRPHRQIALYQLLLCCRPENGEWWYQLGRLQAQCGDWSDAVVSLNRALKLNPQNSDAAMQLASVYTWQGEWNAAETLYRKFPQLLDAKLGLATIAYRRGHYNEAKSLYKEVLRERPDDAVARLGLARCYESQLRYQKAKVQLEQLPDSWRELLDVRSHTNPAVDFRVFFTRAKETDPSFRVPVVKDYYWLSSATVRVPLANRWRLDVKGIVNRQKEEDIFPPGGMNYDVWITGAQLTSRYQFLKDWRWDVVMRGLDAWGVGQEFFPFRDCGRFEPGTTVLYSSETQLLVGDAHYESMVIKNFALTRSELLRMALLDVAYGFKLPVMTHPELEGWITRTFYFDNLHNHKNSEDVWFRFGFPWIEKYFKIQYHFIHGAFQVLSQNYFSYLWQNENNLEGKLIIPITPQFELALLYNRQWQLTHDLFLPIGNFVFVSDRLYLIGNKGTVELTYQGKNGLRLELSGHYYRNTLPYRDWNGRGSLSWQF